MSVTMGLIAFVFFQALVMVYREAKYSRRLGDCRRQLSSSQTEVHQLTANVGELQDEVWGVMEGKISDDRVREHAYAILQRGGNRDLIRDYLKDNPIDPVILGAEARKLLASKDGRKIIESYLEDNPIGHYWRYQNVQSTQELEIKSYYCPRCQNVRRDVELRGFPRLTPEANVAVLKEGQKAYGGYFRHGRQLSTDKEPECVRIPEDK